MWSDPVGYRATPANRNHSNKSALGVASAGVASYWLSTSPLPHGNRSRQHSDDVTQPCSGACKKGRRKEKKRIQTCTDECWKPELTICQQSKLHIHQLSSAPELLISSRGPKSQRIRPLIEPSPPFHLLPSYLSCWSSKTATVKHNRLI